MTDAPLTVSLENDGQLLCLRLARPKANIIDAAMIAALQSALDEHVAKADIKAVLICHDGPHFSFGASVEEHLPGQCAAMLRGLHDLVKAMLRFPAAILVAVDGQCLGGGLEVALAGDLMFVSPKAYLGQPEIKLAVFAPAASCLLPERIGRVVANDLLLSGRSIAGEEAARIGLANAVADDPEAAAREYFEEHLSASSASSLRFAVTAARGEYADRVAARLDAVEAIYLDGLMQTGDAVEGLQAFTEKRAPIWENA